AIREHQNHHSLRFDGQIDERTIDSRQIDANANAFFAAICIDRRLPGMRCKPGKMRTRQFVSDILQRAMQPAQLNVPDWIHWNAKLPPPSFGFQSLNREISKATMWDGRCVSTQRRGYNSVG